MDVVILCNRARVAEETAEADFIKRQTKQEEDAENALHLERYGKLANQHKGGKKRPTSGGGGDSSTAYHGNFRYGKSFEKAKVGFFLQSTRKVG